MNVPGLPLMTASAFRSLRSLTSSRSRSSRSMSGVVRVFTFWSGASSTSQATPDGLTSRRLGGRGVVVVAAPAPDDDGWIGGALTSRHPFEHQCGGVVDVAAD